MIRDLINEVTRRLRPAPPRPDCGLVLTGGGARAAYQAGVLQYIGEHFADTRFSVITGVSAGAINAVHLANHVGSMRVAVDTLVANWKELSAEHVYEPRSGWGMLWDTLRRGNDEPLVQDRVQRLAEGHGLVAADPLRAFLKDKFRTSDGTLRGISDNLRAGQLRACAVVTTSYTTGQTVTWIEGSDIEDWERPDRVGIATELTVEHVLASAALPFFFPAVYLDGAWYGDGGVRLAAPLAPAVHLGADRLLAVSTRHSRSRAEADEPEIEGYPPPAQIMGILANSVFLDALDQDAHNLERINGLLERIPRRRWNGMRPIRLLVMRPSIDIGRLAADYDLDLPGSLRLLTWGTGSDDTKSPDSLSLLLFDRDYIERLIEIGYDDARDRRDDLEAFLAGE